MGFTIDSEEGKGVRGKAFIPEMNGHLRGFWGVNKDLLCFAQRHNPRGDSDFGYGCSVG